MSFFLKSELFFFMLYLLRQSLDNWKRAHQAKAEWEEEETARKSRMEDEDFNLVFSLSLSLFCFFFVIASCFIFNSKDSPQERENLHNTHAMDTRHIPFDSGDVLAVFYCQNIFFNSKKRREGFSEEQKYQISSWDTSNSFLGVSTLSVA